MTQCLQACTALLESIHKARYYLSAVSQLKVSVSRQAARIPAFRAATFYNYRRSPNISVPTYHVYLINLRTELVCPLSTHQRSTEEMWPNLIAMKINSNIFSKPATCIMYSMYVHQTSLRWVWPVSLSSADNTLQGRNS